MPKKCLDISLAKKYGWKPKSDFDKGFDITYKGFSKKLLKLTKNLIFTSLLYLSISPLPGDYCEGVIPDPIPNSEVKPFCADGTLS